MDLIDAHRTFHPNAAEYTFFPDALGTFSRINHMLGHRTNLKTDRVSLFALAAGDLGLNPSPPGAGE